MDSYVVRIYRRDAEKPMKIAGQVEFVEPEETRSFVDAEELMEILCDAEYAKRIRKIKPMNRAGREKRKIQ